MKTNRNFWPWGIILTFVIFLSGMAWVVTIAVTHPDNLVSSNYYEQELQYQQQINATARARKSGAGIIQDTSAGKVVISLNAAELNQNLSGTVEFYRPSSPDLDHEIQLKPGVNGTQVINVSKLATGPWLLRVKWNAGGKAYFLEQRIVI